MAEKYNNENLLVVKIKRRIVVAIRNKRLWPKGRNCKFVAAKKEYERAAIKWSKSRKLLITNDINISRMWIIRNLTKSLISQFSRTEFEEHSFDFIGYFGEDSFEFVGHIEEVHSVVFAGDSRSRWVHSFLPLSFSLLSSLTRIKTEIQLRAELEAWVKLSSNALSRWMRSPMNWSVFFNGKRRRM